MVLYPTGGGAFVVTFDRRVVCSNIGGGVLISCGVGGALVVNGGGDKVVAVTVVSGGGGVGNPKSLLTISLRLSAFRLGSLSSQFTPV